MLKRRAEKVKSVIPSLKEFIIIYFLVTIHADIAKMKIIAKLP